MRKVGGALGYVGLFFADVELGGFVFGYDDWGIFFDVVAILRYSIVVFTVNDDLARWTEIGSSNAFVTYDGNLFGWDSYITLIHCLFFS